MWSQFYIVALSHPHTVTHHTCTHLHFVMFTCSLLHTITHSQPHCITISQHHTIYMYPSPLHHNVTTSHYIHVPLFTPSHCHNITPLQSHPHTITLSPPDPDACGDYTVGVAPDGTPEECDEGPEGGACCTSDCKLKDGAVCRYGSLVVM